MVLSLCPCEGRDCPEEQQLLPHQSDQEGTDTSGGQDPDIRVALVPHSRDPGVPGLPQHLPLYPHHVQLPNKTPRIQQTRGLLPNLLQAAIEVPPLVRASLPLHPLPNPHHNRLQELKSLVPAGQPQVNLPPPHSRWDEYPG